MLIVSDFRDYYDVGMKLGVDKTVVYNRKTTTIKGTFPTINKYDKNGWGKGVLGFCGDFYPFVFRFYENGTSRIIWDVEEALTSLPKSKYSFSWDDESIDTEKGIKTFFNRKYPELENLFHEHKTPIFGFHPYSRRYYGNIERGPYESLVLNPNLKNIQFYKAKDTYSAFQDIFMYISGVLGIDTKPMVEISDKDKAEAKGHGSKYSFRKPPGKRGKNRWR